MPSGVVIKDYTKAWKALTLRNMSTAQRAMGDAIHNRAQMLAPVLTGALKADGRVEQKGGQITVKFGGSSVPYARLRHFENRKNPQTLRYLERAGDAVIKQGIKSFL